MFSDILLTVDFDRTLTAPDTTIPQLNLDAIAWFMDNGGTFTVNNTSEKIPMCYVLTSNFSLSRCCTAPNAFPLGGRCPGGADEGTAHII